MRRWCPLNSCRGWIKLHRELQEKSIWNCSTPEQKVVLITLLLNVNYETKQWEWKGEKYECKPGQIITSIERLAKQCGNGVSTKNVRTALKKFEKYGFLAIETASSGSLITIENWENFQIENIEAAIEQGNERQASGKELANDGQADGKQLANDGQTGGKPSANGRQLLKKDKEGKEYIYNIYTPEFEALWKEYPRKVDKGAAYKSYQARLKEGYTADELLKATKAFADYCRKEKTEEKFIKHGSTFFGPTRPFEDYLNKEEEGSGENNTRCSVEEYYKRFTDNNDSDTDGGD